METHKIRPIAIGIFRRANDILVFESYDEVKKETFYRPLGGGIEFGEQACDTLVREIKEEIGADITNVVYRATFENIFVCNDTPGHEIVLIFDAEIVDPKFYGQDVIPGFEDNGEPLKVVWKSLDFFQSGQAPLYPDGLLNNLQDH